MKIHRKNQKSILKIFSIVIFIYISNKSFTWKPLSLGNHFATINANPTRGNKIKLYKIQEE